MLKPLQQRLLTAAVLLPLAIWAILGLPTVWFALGLGVLMTLGAWEWARLGGLTGRGARMLYAAALAAVGGLLGSWLLPHDVAVWALLALVLLWWIVGLRWVAGFPEQAAAWRQGGAVKGAIGGIVLIPAWLAMVYMHGDPRFGPAMVLFLMFLIWGADSAAFFSGKHWGSRKLAPKVSPGKTWEGVIGALVMTLALAVIGMMLLRDQLGWVQATSFILLCLVTVLFSVLGDLMVSMFKREAGVKDSSSLLPGHGGILDRIDSLTSAAPVFLLGLLLLESAG